MKNALIFIGLAVAAFFAFRIIKARKEAEDWSQDLTDPARYKKAQKKYKTLAAKDIEIAARAAELDLKRSDIPAAKKEKYLSNFLQLQKEPFVAIYFNHWQTYGQKTGKDLIDLIETAPGLEKSTTAKKVIGTYKKLITRKIKP